MTEPAISGEITFFSTDSKPLFSIIKDGGGEWRFQSFIECEAVVDLNWNSVKCLREFMDFHEGKKTNE